MEVEVSVEAVEASIEVTEAPTTSNFHGSF